MSTGLDRNLRHTDCEQGNQLSTRVLPLVPVLHNPYLHFSRTHFYQALCQTEIVQMPTK